MTSRVLSRTTAVIATTGLVSAGLLGVAAAKPHPGKLAATHLTIKSAKTRVTKNDKFKATVTGTLRSHKAPVANEVVGINERKNGVKKWTDTGLSATTDANGKVVIALVQTNAKEQYQLAFAGDSTYRKSHSGAITVNKAKA
jgi:hypothetical protein